METLNNEALPKKAAPQKTEAPAPPDEGTLPKTAASGENPAPPKTAPAKPKKNRKRRIMILIIILLLLLPIFYFLFKYFLSPKTNNYGDTINVNQPADTINVNQNILLATTTGAKRAGAVASSENFDMMQINLEGSGTNVFDFSENEILALDNITSELYSAKEGDKSEIRAMISCQTNKRSFVEVEYFKSGEKDKKIVKDISLGFSHILVIPALDPDSVYKYSLSATDLNQTKIYSEQFVFYSGAGNISLVDILGSAVQKVFGWALGK